MNTQCLTLIISVLSVASLGLAQSDNSNLVCYDCDPLNNAEQCAQPTGNGLPQINCAQQITGRDANSTLLCLSAYLTFTGAQENQTGIYRGCKSQNSSVVNFCDWFKEEITSPSNIVLTSCVTCNSSRCNNVTLYANGNQGNGSSLLQVALMMLGISVLFVSFF